MVLSFIVMLHWVSGSTSGIMQLREAIEEMPVREENTVLPLKSPLTTHAFVPNGIVILGMSVHTSISIQCRSFFKEPGQLSLKKRQYSRHWLSSVPINSIYIFRPHACLCPVSLFLASFGLRGPN